MPRVWVEEGTGRIRRNLSKLDYRWRFTVPEQVALKWAQRAHPSDEVRDTLAVLEASLAAVEEASGVDVEDPRTIDGAAFCVGVLAAMGIIGSTEPEIAARLALVLAPPAAE